MFTRRHLLGVAGLAGITAGVSACTGTSSPEEMRGTPSPVNLDAQEIAETNRAVTVTASVAWGVRTGHPDVLTRNTVISPSSLAVSLAMLGEGATGVSESSMDKTFEIFSDRRSKAVGALCHSLAGYADLPSGMDSDNPPETPKMHQTHGGGHRRR